MKLYNTLSRTKEVFEPINKDQVNVFVCGPTVYDYQHIGNGRTAITMDILVKTLKYLGYSIDAIMNITDLDDKIIQRANDNQEDWRALSTRFESTYKKDMEALEVTSFRYIRATDHIDDILKQVQVLLDKGFAYKVDDGIYFEIAKFAEYGKLSGRNKVREDDAESRVDSSDQKRGWNDFCIWKFSKKNEPVWDAPFGAGRPGWHIEDTAITEHYFGPQYDIHGGGSDLMFPHHEAELTLMESASGKTPFVKYWAHGGLLYTSGKRMGKSNHNFLTIHETVEKYEASVVRLAMAQSHYRSQLDFSPNLFEKAKDRLNRWRAIGALVHQEQPGDSDEAINSANKIIKQFVASLEDDLSTPEAIATIELFNDLVNEHGMTGDLKKKYQEFQSIIKNTLGIDITVNDLDESQKGILEQRRLVRDEKDWVKSDELRDSLLEQGISVKDTDHGQQWSRVN